MHSIKQKNYVRDEKKIGEAEKDFVHKSSDCFLQPLKAFLDGQMRNIQVRAQIF